MTRNVKCWLDKAYRPNPIYPLSHWCRSTQPIPIYVKIQIQWKALSALQYVLTVHMIRGQWMHTGVWVLLQHKAVAKALREPVRYKETSHTTFYHYDNQAESFSLIYRHSTRHRNPIALTSYITTPLFCSPRHTTHPLKVNGIHGDYIDFLCTVGLFVNGLFSSP